MPGSVSLTVGMPAGANGNYRAEPAEEWRVISKFYSEVTEIWSVDATGALEFLVAEIPMDPGEDLQETERKARLLASLPEQIRALRDAPAPPDWSDASKDGSRLEATLLHWLGSEYLPWYRGQRSCALTKASAADQSVRNGLNSGQAMLDK